MAKHAKKDIAPLMQLRPSALAANEYELLIYGDIGDSWWGESVTALDIVQQLLALPASVAQLNVRINSYGGSVSDGLAIYNALKRVPASKIVTIDGVAMSSATLPAMAGDEIQMPPTSLMMIHAPWSVVQGNAEEMREMAQILDTFASTMVTAYTAKTGMQREDMLALLTDGQDHYYTGEQAVEQGFADTLITDPADDETQNDLDLAAAAGLQRLLARAPENMRHLAIVAAARKPRFDVTTTVTQPNQLPNANAAAAATQQANAAAFGEALMKLKQLRAKGGFRNQVVEGGEGGSGAPAAANQATQAAVLAGLRERNDQIRAMFEPHIKRDGVQALKEAALMDPSASIETISANLLKHIGSQTEPVGTIHIENGPAERDKLRGAAEQQLLARYGIIKGADADRARQGNPFASSTLISMAERMLVLSGVNTRTMGREEIAKRALAAGGQTTGDFPVLLENVLHKTLIGAYAVAPFTWTRFCTTGTLVDYRPHGRYHLSSFSDLKSVNEAGEYENGALGDAVKETIQGQRKGRILQLTPETLINDDLGALVRLASALGQAAGRTIEKDVYALFGLNGGNGPTMGDGKPLFDATHANIANNAAVPGVAVFDQVRQQMASQKDPAGNDYLDITPSIWLGPLSQSGAAKVVNRSEYDPDTPNKLQRVNIANNLFADIVDTPRLTGTAWYALAAPGTEPVFEVAFLDGQQSPTLEQEINFRSDGLAWKAVHRYGVAAIGWRGIVKNPGAAN